MNSMKHRGSREGERNLAPISALPLKCLTVKKLTGSGRYFGSATEMANSNKPALSSWPLATNNGKSKDKSNGNAKTFRRRLTLISADDPQPQRQRQHLCH